MLSGVISTVFMYNFLTALLVLIRYAFQDDVGASFASDLLAGKYHHML